MSKSTGHKLIEKLGLMPPNKLNCLALANHFDRKLNSYSHSELVGINAVSRGHGFLGVSEALQSTKKPVVLLGKGMVFDSGGANIKLRSMEEMKFDMLGAATVLGVQKDLKKGPSIVYMGAIADNYFGEGMLYPSYVLEYSDGTKVEVINTDAEGRLVLADGIIESKKYDPKLIITVATLTGSAAAALGPGTAVFSNSEEYMWDFMEAVGKTKELAWEMPIWDCHRKNIKGMKGVADIKNCGTIAGASTAAAFLEHFAGDTPWLHLDIAGSAYEKGKPTGAMRESLIKFLGAMK